MPLYEYRCKSCGVTNEFRMKFSDPNPEECKECGEMGLEKMLSKTSFQLKGGGWYVTDFRDSGKKKPKEDPAGAPKDAASETKDAPKSETPSSESSGAPPKTDSKDSPKASPKKSATPASKPST